MNEHKTSTSSWSLMSKFEQRLWLIVVFSNQKRSAKQILLSGAQMKRSLTRISQSQLLHVEPIPHRTGSHNVLYGSRVWGVNQTHPHFCKMTKREKPELRSEALLLLKRPLHHLSSWSTLEYITPTHPSGTFHTSVTSQHAVVSILVSVGE